MEAALELKNVSKRFGAFTALNDVSLMFRRGQVHALMGENGAGKSTLVKLIAGVLAPTEGALVGPLGKPLNLRSPRDALSAGIGVVHQELDLFDNLTVAENIALGPASSSRFKPSHRQMHEKATEALGMLDDSLINPETIVGNLTTSEKQLVAISRALSEKSSLILFDEPTSSLNSADAARLHAQIKGLRARGVTIVYITHKLGEVFDIADNVSVVRDGCLVSSKPIADVSYDGMISDILGHSPARIFAGRSPAAVETPVVLRVTSVSARNVRDVSFDIRKGEIVALAGLPGSGPTELLKILFGLELLKAGSVEFNGVARKAPSPRGAIQSGVGYLPSNRLTEGILPLMSVLENIEATSKAMAESRSTARRDGAMAMLKQMNVRTSDPSLLITSLSGGNQQKALIGRWLMMKPGLLLLDDPTRGVDIGSKAEIYHLLRRLAENGMAVVFTSSDSIELSGLADRILIFRDGQIAEELHGNVSYEQLDHKISG